MAEVETQWQVLLSSLDTWYLKNPEAFDTMKQVLNGTIPVSLRVLDFLVTNYAKASNIVYSTRAGTTFNMFLEYTSQLDAYHKCLFDPFARKHKVKFRGIKTSCGQLNFFKWAMINGVLDYARQHYEVIEAEMMRATQHRTAQTHNAPSGKRKQLSVAAIKTCTTTHIKVRVRLC